MSSVVSTNWMGPSANVLDKPWYTYDRESGCNEQLANHVIETVQDIEQRQMSIGEGNRRHARLYCGYTPIGLTWGSGPGINVRNPFEATKNIARGVCDTAASLIVKSRPKSTFVTDGADWDIQMQAEDMDQFMLGANELSGLYQVSPRAFLDSAIFGTGGWKYITCGTGDNFHVETERILIDDIVVDEDECRTGLTPDCIYHRTMVRTDALIRKYANGDNSLDESKRLRINASQENTGWPTRHVPRGRCILIEATYVDPTGILPSRRILCTQGVVLKDSKWGFDFHPYTFLWWSLPVSGFYGDGVCYRQYGRQQRITFMYRWIQRVQDLYGTPRAWVDPQGGPPTLQMSNEIGTVISARKPPSFQITNPVPSDTYKWLNELETGGFEDEGMSSVSGQGYLPPGVDSAPAQREWNFKETQKFAPVSQRWEHALAVETAHKTIALYANHVEKSGTKPKVSWINKSRMFTVKFPDLDRDAYIIRADASSLDSMSPAARVQSALELAQTQWITPQEGRALIAHPDLKESDDLGNSGEAYGRWALKQLRSGNTLAVDEKVDLKALDRIIRQGRALAITQGEKQSIIDGMSRFIEEIDVITSNMMNAAAAPTQGQMQQQVPLQGSNNPQQ